MVGKDKYFISSAFHHFQNIDDPNSEEKVLDC